MGKKVCNKHFRDPTAEEVFWLEGVEKEALPDDEEQERNIKGIVIKEERLNGISFSPFFNTRSDMKRKNVKGNCHEVDGIK